jgi:hypothetical protein
MWRCGISASGRWLFGCGSRRRAGLGLSWRLRPRKSGRLLRVLCGLSLSLMLMLSRVMCAVLVRCRWFLAMARRVAPVSELQVVFIRTT